MTNLMDTDKIDTRCKKCDANCCRYFCFEIDKPDTFGEFEDIRWYLMHEGVSVHVDSKGDWYISIENICKMLRQGRNGAQCADYENRPLICRKHSPETCEFTVGQFEYDELFTTPEQLVDYARRMLGEKSYARSRARMHARK